MMYDLVSERRTKYCVKISQPEDAYSVVKRYAKKAQEHFIAITLDGAHQVIGVRIITVGLVNRTVVHPREVFRQAIIDNAAAIIVAHNHPSGVLTPSEEDIDITKRLKEASNIIGISLLDHLIFSRMSYQSLVLEGHIK